MRPTKTVDVIIVGQGLAGTTLAWLLRDAGADVLLLDPGHAITASRISAGLVTPIAGQRLTRGWPDDARYHWASAFYGNVGARTGTEVFTTREAVRLFADAEEAALWPSRRAAHAAWLADLEPGPLVDPAFASSPFGGFAMKAAQLDVATYLEASRRALSVVEATVDWRTDVVSGPQSIRVGEWCARFVISCEGYAARHNPYFSALTFQCAKGDILTVRFQRHSPQRTLHRGIWIAPTADPAVAHVGATFDWNVLDETPSPEARAELEHRLRAFVRVPFEVIGHRAAVRPIIRGAEARIGCHPAHPRIGIFNGLGAKGVIRAPWFARLLVAALMKGTPLPETVDVAAVLR